MDSLYDTQTKVKFFLGLILAFAFILKFTFAFADPVADKLNQSQQQLLQINEQINNYQEQISSTQDNASSLKNEISIYNDQVASTQLEIEARQTQIDNANLQITQLQQLIDQKIQDIADNRQVLAQLVVELNEDDDRYAINATLLSDSFTDFLDQIEYNQNLQSQVSQLTDKIKDLKTQLQGQQNDLQTQVSQLQALQTELQVTQSSLTTVRDQKQQLLYATQGSEKNFQKLLSTSKAQEINLEKEIETLDDEAGIKVGKNKIVGAPGILAWPIDGIITQGYGNTGFTALGYNFHNGIDIAGPPGQPIYAAADGDVVGTDESGQDFGNWVALKSTVTTAAGPAQIVTLYGHMEKFIVSMGQHLSQGDLIGYEGNTGNTTARLYGPERGYHLHFGVYDATGFTITEGAYTKIYGPYKVPSGYTYNPLDFLSPN